MKKIFLVVIVLFANIFAFSQEEEGIKFFDNSFKDAINQAKKQNKLIFIDFYTVWCGPCKMMAKKIFTQKNVGDFYNRNFINLKIDAEKGEGVELANKYNVFAYPTSIFIDSTANIVIRHEGMMDTTEFIKMGEKATKLGAAIVETKNTETKKDSVYYINKIKELTERGMGNFDAIEEYYKYKGIANLTEKDINLICSLNPAGEIPYNTNIFNLILNKSDKIKCSGYPEIYSFFHSIFEYNFRVAAKEKNKELFQNIYSIYQKCISNKKDFFISFYIIDDLIVSYYENIGDKANLKSTAIAFVEKYYNRYSASKNQKVYKSIALNEYAWKFFENFADEKETMQNYALPWALKSVKLSSNYYNNDTVANIYYALGDKTKAKKYAETSIKLAKKNKVEYEQYKGTEELLNKIKTGK